MTIEEKLEIEFEDAVGELYRVMFNYRENKLYKQEYNISTLISMLLQDKLHLYTKYKDQID